MNKKESFKNMWAIYSPNGGFFISTLSYQRKWCIENYRKLYPPNTKHGKWSYWRRKGYKYVKVNVTIEEVSNV